MKNGISYLILVVILFVMGLINSLIKPNFMLSSEANRVEVIPVASTMKALSFGFDNIVADIYWLKEIQYIGKHLETDKRFSDLYFMTDFITDMDNHFIAPYYISAFILASDERNPIQARKLLDKGIENNPTDYILMNQSGFIAYYYIKNSLLAADYYEKAGNAPNAPKEYYQTLVKNLRGKGLDRSAEIALMQDAYDNAKDPITKKMIAYRITLYVITANLDDINRALYMYHQKYNKYPADLNELVSKRYLRLMPQDPRGFDYKYDNVNGLASTQKLEAP
jgi:hypothetical protein